MLQCFINTVERHDLFEMIQALDPFFKDLLPVDKSAYLMTLNDEQISTWDTLVHNSFDKRDNYMQLWTMIHAVL